jgi:hypothetical protein
MRALARGLRYHQSVLLRCRNGQDLTQNGNITASDVVSRKQQCEQDGLTLQGGANYTVK